MKDYQIWFEREFPQIKINRPWSILPDTACFLFDWITKNRPANILEFGSGISTAVMARAAASYGGFVYSLEHGECWKKETERVCGSCGVENFQVIHAPLVKGHFDGVEDYVCYDPGRIPDRKFDFVLIDGPPGFGEGAPGRRGTLYMIWSFLGENAVILLDDADREGERVAVMEWMECFGEKLVVRYVSWLERAVFLMRRDNMVF